jgi:PAS domain S-box-containing protein
MGIDWEDSESNVRWPADRSRGLARLGGIVDWLAADKSLLTAGIVLSLHLYVIGLLYAAQANLDRLPFLEPRVLVRLIELNFGTVAMWVLLGLLALLFRRSHGDSAFFEYAPIQVYAFSNSVYAYFLGYFTEPFGFVTLIGGIMVGLPLYGARATRAGLFCWLGIFTSLNLLNLAGQIPYAPLLSSSPAADGSLSLAWALGMSSINVTGGILAGVFSFSMYSLLRRRDQLLTSNQGKLLAAVQNLSETKNALEESGRELELRVDERTLELKVSNRNLQFEMEEREKSTKELRSIRAAMESAIEGVARVDADGKIQSANAAFLAMHGASSDEMIGSAASSWVEAGARAEMMGAILGLQVEQKVELSVRGLRLDKSDFPQFVAMVRVPEGVEGEHYRFARDVTRQSELSSQLNHAMKMEAIGRLAGGIAHDFNNLLMAILTAGEQLQTYFRQIPSASEQLELADMVTMGGTRAAALTTQLLDFAHVQPPSLANIDINKSLEDVLDLLSPALAGSVEIESDLSSEALFTSGDPSRFDSGLLNVALNASDAMPEGGRLVIQTKAVTIDISDPSFASFDLKSSRQVRIRFIDDGLGMDAATAAQVFDPFFTTKPAGKGTGLGLSVLSAYVGEVGGALKISSALGKGTTCSIYVPLAEEDSQSIQSTSAAKSAQGNETILLAEDEEIVAKATTMLLSHSGYGVIHSSDGLAAVNVYRERRSEIDLVLLDYRMPGLNGAEAFLQLREINPEVPVILMSGNLSVSEFRDLEEKGLHAILRKPCSGTELTDTVRRVLDARGRSG